MNEISTLLYLAQLCQASYTDTVNATFWHNVADLRVGILPSRDLTDIVFRGSHNVSNWIRDLFVVPKRSFDGYWIHGGVADACALLMPLVIPLIPKDKRIRVTGHSLGGGIAREFGRRLKCEAITFGALKTDFRFGAMPINIHRRIVCSDDPVPWVPGALYVQDCAPSLCLKAPDGEIVNPEDHCMSVYIKRLEAINGTARLHP